MSFGSLSLCTGSTERRLQQLPASHAFWSDAVSVD
uniref:Uncharacterized protein n=1 Tax=Anguilla anguilla TaxID=7936 RepID=A0A0E9T8T8_ANGAN